MDAKWVALVLFALLAGLSGSFIFSYFIYQPQIASLRAELNELRGQIAELRSTSLSPSTLLELRSELDELKSTLLNLNSILVELNYILEKVLSALSSEQYLRYERLEITSIYAEYGNIASDTKGWNIVITIKNTGTADATIDNILLNGKPYATYQDVTVNFESSATIKAGQYAIIMIGIPEKNVDNWPFQHGVSVEVRLHSVSGREYPKTVTLP